MAIVTITYHEHKWGILPSEPGWRYCHCRRFMVHMPTSGELREPTLTEMIELERRVNARDAEQAKANARAKGLIIP